jgi:hypothetical protein
MLNTMRVICQGASIGSRFSLTDWCEPARARRVAFALRCGIAGRYIRAGSDVRHTRMWLMPSGLYPVPG